MEERAGFACQGQEVGKLSARSSSPIRCGNREPELCWSDAEKEEKEEKGSNFISDGTTSKDDNLIKDKDVECPNSVSRLGKTEPSSSTGESLRQALNPNPEVVKVGPEVDVGFPLQTTAGTTQAVALRDSTEGTITRPIGPVEANPAEISSTERISSQTIELSGRIHRRPIRVLLDSGSTGNYISDKIAQDFNLIINAEEGSEQLTLADGSKVQARGYVSFRLRCGQFISQVIARVFPNMHQQLILGIPWLKQENPRIDWRQGQVSIIKNGQIIYLPCHRQRNEDLEELDCLRTMCTAKAFQHELKNQSPAFLGILRAVKSEDKDGQSGEGTSTEVTKLQREDLPDNVWRVCQEFEAIFPKDLPKGVPPRRMGHEFKIDLEPDTAPIHRPIYKLSPLELQEAKTQIDSMLEHGFIRPSQSPWGSPVLFVPKKDGGLRFCVDYRWLNKRTIRNRYPLPLPEEMMDRLRGSQVFSKIDLRSGYWQMPVRDEDVPKTAFRTRWGSYEFLVMPFGVTNAPSQFMHLVQDVLREYLDDFVIVFIDDILIFSRTTEEHCKHLRLVFKRLAEQQVYAKASKCLIHVKELEFLGQWITTRGVAPVKGKLNAVRAWETPINVKDIRSFLGFANYYRRFVPGYASIASPLTMLTKKDVQWHWGPLQRKAFEDLKSALCAAPLLIYPDPSLPYTVVSDASGDAAGGVLMQDQGEGLRPVAFMSRAFKPTEQRYSAYERELAAVAYCFIQWRHYLEGCPGGVTVVTDHKPLTLLMDQQVLSRSQTRWIRLGLFQSIQPKIKYLPGKANVVADALSRSKPPRDQEQEFKQSKREVMKNVEEETTPVQDQSREFFNLIQASTISLSKPQVQQFLQAQATDHDIIKLLEQSEKELKRQHLQKSPQGILYRMQDGHEQVLVPQSLRQEIMKEHHDVPLIGHVGVHRTVDHIKRAFWWKGLWGDVGQYVRSCPVCQLMKSDHRKKAGLLQPIPLPERKWQQITTDLVTDLPESEGMTAIAVFVDRLTKMVHFVPCRKDISAQQYARLFIDQVFKLHGLPEVIISDRDPRFLSKFWDELFTHLGTDLRFSTAFHPQTDGQSEVTNRVMENFLRPYVERTPHTWVQQLPLAEFAANNAISVSTGFSPFYLNAGIHPTMPTSLMTGGLPKTTNEAVQVTLERMKTALAEAQTNLALAQKRMATAVNRSRRSVEFQVGDEVVLLTKNIKNYCPHLPAKIKARWVGPFTITQQISPVAYRVELPPGWRLHPVFHVDKLKKYIRSEEFLREVHPPPPVVIEDHLEYEVEDLIRHRGKGTRRQYLVLWKGYPFTEATWEYERDLVNAPEILEAYLRRNNLMRTRDGRQRQ